MTNKLIAAAIAAITALLAVIAPALARSPKAPLLEIIQPWTRATPKGSKVAGGFLTIRNTGKVADALIGGSFAASARVEIHEMAVVNDIMRMRELPHGLTIAPGQTVVLKPGSYHVMFMGLKRQLKQGEAVEGTLIFKHAGTIKVVFMVGAMGQMHQGAHGGHGMKHQGMKHH